MGTSTRIGCARIGDVNNQLVVHVGMVMMTVGINMRNINTTGVIISRISGHDVGD